MDDLVYIDGETFYVQPGALDALAAALNAAHYAELPRVRSFALTRVKSDLRKTYININTRTGKITLGGTDRETARALLLRLAGQEVLPW
jgi:hypothetical protein